MSRKPNNNVKAVVALLTALLAVPLRADPPVANDDVATTPEDVSVLIDVLANDQDVDGDALRIDAVGAPTNGMAAIEGSSIRYTPNPDYHGPDSLTYTVTDDNGGFATATVLITVTPENDPPVAADDAGTVAEDDSVVIDVIANDQDIDGDTLTVQSVGAATNGVTAIEDANSVRYTPNPGFHGLDSFTYTVGDGNGGSATATVSITVNPVNDAPVAVNDNYTVDEDDTLSVSAPGVLANDTDADGDALTAVLVSDVSNGTLTLNADGSFTYIPDPDFDATDSFTYQAHDADGPSNTATVTITVNPVNDAPVAVNDNYTIDEDVTLSMPAPGVLANDTDVDGDTLNAVLITGASNGTLSLSADGSFTYTPNAHFEGTDSFTYQAHDADGPSNTATVTITVNPVNDAPVADDDDYAVDEDKPLSIAAPGVLGNDTDVEDDPLTAALVSGASNGLVVLNADGSFTYTPNENFEGTDSFTYEANDGEDTSNVATVTITVNPVNDAPVAADDDYTVDEDEPLSIAAPGVLANDTDVEDDSLTAALVSGASNGQVTLNADGSFTYTPNEDFEGTDSFTYTANDGEDTSNVATVTITVNPVNDAPVALGESYAVDEDDSLSVPAPGVLANDTDADGDGLTAVLVSDVSNGTLTLSADGSFTYVPDPDFDETDSFTYQAYDGTASSNVVVVTIDVRPLNDAPVAQDDSYSVDEDLLLEVAAPGVLDNDSDVDEDDLIALLDTPPANGVLELQPDGSFSYQPNADFHGTDSFRYTVQDPDGASDTATVTLTVSSVNDLPALQDDVYSTPEDVPLVVGAPGVLANDSDVEDDTLTVDSHTQPANGDVTVAPDGSFTYTPHLDFNGQDTFQYTVVDSDGGSSTATVTITIGGVNDAPRLQDDDVSTPEDTPIIIDVLANDEDVDDPHESLVIVSAGLNGFSEGEEWRYLSREGDIIGGPNAVVNITPDNKIEYIPKAHFHGQDFFTYTVRDPHGATSTATVNVTVVPVNDPPIGGRAVDGYTMTANTVLNVGEADGLLVDAWDVDAAHLDENDQPVGGETIRVDIVTHPANGILEFDEFTGAFTYTPNSNFVGLDLFEFRLTDGSDFSEVLFVREVTIIDPPPPPEPPEPGEVVVPWELSNVPLEQSSSVPPNVLVVMDDSGSMDWNISVPGMDDTGGMVLSNNRYSISYTYLYYLGRNLYSVSAANGRVLPTEKALDDAGRNNPSFGVWRARNHKFNRLYYNPEVTYTPWVGLDDANRPFGNADPANIRLDPNKPATGSNRFSILAGHSYTAYSVPRGTNNTVNVNVNNMYIPHYYVTSAEPPLQPSDPHTLVEIRNNGGTYVGGPNRTDCANPMACTYAEEIQNFANYFQYYRTREYAAKASLGKVISRVQDVRVGYETINQNVSVRVEEMNGLYTEGKKKDLLDEIYESRLRAEGTPLRNGLKRAGEIFSGNVSNRDPMLSAPEGYCQQNFALLFSDGYWSGSSPNLPNSGHQDSVSGPWSGGRYGDNHGNTLADVAMYYYRRDIRDDLQNLVPASQRDILGRVSGSFGDGAPRMHQHMKTYTVAFGVLGDVDPSEIPTNPAQPFSWPNPTSSSQGKIDDMLHAAVNGRGQFLSAVNPQELQDALERAFLEFTSAASSTSAAAFNSTSLQEDTLLYRGFYDLRTSTGELTATTIDANGNLAPEPLWRASDELDDKTPASRKLVTWNPESASGVEFTYANLSADQRAVLTAAQVSYLRGDRSQEQPDGTLRQRPVSRGLLGDIVNSSPVYVGQPRAVARDQAPYPTTDLYSQFADTHRNRAGVVYVGANDGILHGFNAATGEEVFGYVPSKIIDASQSYRNTLDEYTDPFYQHKYYVDLTPRLNDVYMRTTFGGSRAWRTVLLGGLGAGGKGYFALNVTDPDSLGAGSVLWEFTDEDDTTPEDWTGGLDPLGKPVKDLGYAVSLPTVAMSNVGSSGQKEWVAIFGNGPNSTAGIAKLFVLFMERGLNGWQAGDFVKIDTGFGVQGGSHPLAGYPNGLGSPTAVDIDLNGTVDRVYAGDRLGNLYRFDLSDANPDQWTATRLFTAAYTQGGIERPQPILSQPLVMKHPTEEGFLVIFGTGSYMTKEDADSEDIQSIYAIWDHGAAVPVTAQPNTKAERLVEQTITNVIHVTNGQTQTRRTVTENPVDYRRDEGSNPGIYGWYIDLDMPPAGAEPGADPQFPGEKAIRRFVLRDGAIVTTTVLPSLDEFSCFGTRPGSILLFDALTGGDAGRPVVDFNRDGKIDAGDLVGEQAAGLLFDQSDLDGVLVDLSTLGGQGDTDWLFACGGNDCLPFRISDENDSRTGRLSWRELIQDN